MKKYVKIFLIAFAVIGITVKPFLVYAQDDSQVSYATPNKVFSADVQDISGPKYFPAVKEAIVKAEKSITAVMYLIELPQSKTKDKVQELVDELIKAHERGVKVEIILDQNIDFVHQRYEGDWLQKIRSFRAYKQLKKVGVAVHYDEISTYTHAKAIVIDEKVVILGSTNWTKTSLERSIEADVLMNSEEAAKSYLEYFKTIKIDESIEKYIEFIKSGIAINNNFMRSPKLFPEMMKEHDERSFDIYLFLLKESKDPSTPLRTSDRQELIFDYDKTAEYLGIDKRMDRVAYRRQITKVLRKLEKKYKLIKLELQYANDAKITLLDTNAGTNKIFHLPNDYFNFDWNKELSMRAKFCYLINFSEANVSDTQPYWSKSVKELRQKYGNISGDVIADGMGELRRRKLIDVMYDALPEKDYSKRRPKMYKVLKTYDPEKLNLELARVAEKYGETEYKTARKYAEIVFEENNPKIIEDIILKTKEYGSKKVKEAFAIVAKKNIDNPKRIYIYVVGILENWGE